MHRLIGSSAARFQRYSWFICCGLLVVLLSLVASIFSDAGLRVHAATGSSLKNIHSPWSHHLNSHHLRATDFSHRSLIKLKPQVLVLSRTSPPDNARKNSTNLLQQQSTHGFTVQRVPSRTIRPLVNSTYQVGQTVEYTLAINNSSTAGALITDDPITVTDAIPTGLTGLTVSASSSDWTISLGATTSPTMLTATYIGTYPVLPGAALSPIIVVGTLTTPAIPHVANTAVVATPLDSNAVNNSSTSTITVVAQPDLTVTDPVPTGTTFEVGKPVTYTITGSSLSSAGPVLAGNTITLTDTIPAGLTGITATDSSGNWDLHLSSTSGASILTATYIGSSPVLAGTTLPPITITGTLTSAAVANLANNAAISTPNESDTTNNTASNTIPVVVQPDLTLTKTVPTGTTFQVGKPVTYTFTAHNASSVGPILTGDSIIITDPIPVGLTGLTASANSDWGLSLGATTSPTTLTATYTGTYPVASGATLSSITLTGTPTTTALDVSSTRAGYWPFDENSGTITYDSTSNHYNGTINGATWATGKFNSALNFNGTSNYVNMGTPSALEFNNTSFTVASWFKSTSTAGSRMVSTGLSLWNSGFYLGLNNSSCNTGCVSGDLGADGTTAHTVAFDTTTTFNDNQWHQAVMVIDQTAKTAQIYVDGVAQPLSKSFCGTVSGTTINFSTCSSVNTYSTTEPFTVGAYKGAGGTYQFFSGSLDEVRVYGSALSSAQVQSLYPNPQLTNTATVTTPNDGNNANNGATAAITVQPQPDLTLTKSVALAPTLSVRGQAQEQRLRSILRLRTPHSS